MARTLACAVAALSLLPVAGTRPARAGTNDAVAAGVASAVATTAFCAALAIGARDDDDQADDEGYDRRGWLARIAGAYGNLLDSGSEDGFGIDGGAGYRCHPRMSSEVQVEWIDGFRDDRAVSGVSSDARVDAETVTITASTKGYILTGRFQPYVLVGLGAMTVDTDVKDRLGVGPSKSDSEADFAMRFGGGLDFYATKNVVVDVGVGYVYPFGDVSDFDYLSVRAGVQYRF